MTAHMPGQISNETYYLKTDCTNVAHLLEMQFQSRPDHKALTYQNVSLTYKDLYNRSRTIAAQLNALGVGPNDKVGLMFPNLPDYVAAFFAVAGLAATIVPINPLLKSEEIAHILADSQAKALVVHEPHLPEIVRALPFLSGLEHVVVSRSSKLPLSETIEKEAGQASFHPTLFKELTADSQIPHPPSSDWPRLVVADKDLAALVYTSGTTGKPKGAMLTHKNLLFTVETALADINVNEADTFLAVLPLCHIYGMAVVMVGTISRGGKLAILEKFDASDALKLIEQDKVTVLPAVPTMYQFMLMELDKNRYDLSSVRLCISGAAALPTQVLKQVEQAFGATLLEGFGLTECTSIASINRLNGIRKPGSVGQAFSGVSVKIVDDNGKTLSPGKDNVGEITIKGPNVMLGYYGLQEASLEVLQDGWFFTGDLGYIDDDNCLFIVGRKKELIIRGGQNIYPRELEDVILRLPQVAEVAVIGVPDQFMGERVKAVVVLRKGQTLSEDDIKAHCAKSVAEYKVPRLIEFIDALPRNSTGKVLKRLISSQASESK